MARLKRVFPGRVTQEYPNGDRQSTHGSSSYVAHVRIGPSFAWEFYVDDGKISHIASGYFTALGICFD